MSLGGDINIKFWRLKWRTLQRKHCSVSI